MTKSGHCTFISKTSFMFKHTAFMEDSVKKIHFDVPEQTLHNMHEYIYLYIYRHYLVLNISMQKIS